MWFYSAPSVTEKHGFFLATPEFCKDICVFGAFGFAMAIVQQIGFQKFHALSTGSKLLQEHIAFESLGVFTILLWLIKAPFIIKAGRLRQPLRIPTFLGLLIAQVEKRLLALGSVATTSMLGFSMGICLVGDRATAAVFLYATLYFASLTEIAMTPAASIRRLGFLSSVAVTTITPVLFPLLSKAVLATG